MFHKFRWSVFSIAVILALLVSAFPLGAVMAEGEDPAPEEVPQTEEQSATTEAPLLEEEAPPLTVEEVVAQVPEEVVVVPADPSGEVLSLAEEATASALVSGDPVYCPGSAVWGDLLCTGALPTIEDALAAAAISGSGTIYVAVDYTDLTPSPVVIDGIAWSDAPSWLNLIGGVDFSTGEVTGKTVLNRPINVTNLLSFWMENFVISGVQNTALDVAQTEDVYLFNSDLSDNQGRGLAINVSGDAILGEVKVNNNGGLGNDVHAGYVSLYDVSASGNLNGHGMLVSSTSDLAIESSKFNNNLLSGLSTYVPNGVQYILCSQAMNNGDTGMRLQTYGGDTMLLCNKMTGNGEYGLEVDASGTIYMGSNTISGNEQIDQLLLTSPNPVVEQYAPCSYLCPSCKGGSGGEEEKPAEGKTQVVIVNVNDPNGSVEFKAGYATVFKLMEDQDGNEKEIQRTILMSGSAPDGSTGVYTPLDESQLPAPFGEGTTFMPYGFNLAISNPDGSPLDALIGYMVIRFYLPEGFVLPGGMRLVIQYFDPATSSWTPMSTGVGGGMAYTYTSKPGTYMLTMVPIQ